MELGEPQHAASVGGGVNWVEWTGDLDWGAGLSVALDTLAAPRLVWDWDSGLDSDGRGNGRAGFWSDRI